MLLCGAVHYIDTAGGARTAADRMCAVARYNNISSKADPGDIFIVHDEKSSYDTPLLGRNHRPGAPDHKGTLVSDLKGARPPPLHVVMLMLWDWVWVLEPDGLGEEAPPKSLMLRKHLPDGSKMKRRLPGWFESLMILTALLLQRLR